MPAITDFQNTAAKLSAAQAALPALQSAVTSASNAVENARTTIASMETQIATANANLKTAKAMLASQLVAGSDTTATITSINSLQTQISGFSDAKAILNQQLTQLQQSLNQANNQLGEGQKAVDYAQYCDVVYQYTQGLLPLIPLARAIRASGRISTAGDYLGASLLIDTKALRFGPFKLNEPDGTIWPAV